MRSVNVFLIVILLGIIGILVGVVWQLTQDLQALEGVGQVGVIGEMEEQFGIESAIEEFRALQALAVEDQLNACNARNDDLLVQFELKQIHVDICQTQIMEWAKAGNAMREELSELRGELGR